MAALLVSRTLADAAIAAEVGERTLRRWLDSEPFATAYREAARQAAREAVSALLAAQGEAVAVLRANLHTGTPATQVRAARALLELGVRVREDDTDERLRALELEVEAWQHDGTTTGSVSTLYVAGSRHVPTPTGSGSGISPTGT